MNKTIYTKPLFVTINEQLEASASSVLIDNDNGLLAIVDADGCPEYVPFSDVQLMTFASAQSYDPDPTGMWAEWNG